MIQNSLNFIDDRHCHCHCMYLYMYVYFPSNSVLFTRCESRVYLHSLIIIQWNLSKADTIGTMKWCPLYGSVRFIEITFNRVWPKKYKIGPKSLSALQRMSALWCARLREILLYLHSLLNRQYWSTTLSEHIFTGNNFRRFFRIYHRNKYSREGSSWRFNLN